MAKECLEEFPNYFQTNPVVKIYKSWFQVHENRFQLKALLKHSDNLLIIW